MSQIVRQFLKIFGTSGASGNFGQFGSKKAGSPLTTKDIPTIQALDAWVNGLQDAVVSANKAPYIQDINSVFYTLAYQIAYILQSGIPEWDSSTTYYVGNMARRPGTALLYQSLQDNNTNALPGTATVPASDAFWQVLTQTGLATGIIVPYANSPAPDGWLLCRGDAISRTAFPALFANLGVLWGAGDGSTTFNLPDLRGRTLFGFSSGVPPFDIIGASSYGGANTHTHTQPAHNHSVPTLNLKHVVDVNDSPFTVTSDQFSQNGGPMGINPTPSGIGSVQRWKNINAQTDTNTTGDANPAIASASNIPAFGVINYIIKS